MKLDSEYQNYPFIINNQFVCFFTPSRQTITDMTERLNWAELIHMIHLLTDDIQLYLISLTYMQRTSWNAGLEDAQPGIKIARWNISNLRYADDTTLMAESEKELKSLLMKVKEESEKVGLKLNLVQKTKILASGPITSWEIDQKTVETVSDFIFGVPKSLQMLIAAMKLKDAYNLEGKLWPT